MQNTAADMPEKEKGFTPSSWQSRQFGGEAL
jgi:hypothetical protein